MIAIDRRIPIPGRHLLAPARLIALASMGLSALLVLIGFAPSAARAAGSDWTAQEMFGTPYTGTSFGERFRYSNPRVLPFADGTAEAIWTDVGPPLQAIRGRHLGADAKPTADAYDIGFPSAALAVPRSKVAPLTGSLGIVVMDATISETERRVYGRLLGPNGPVGAIFEISAAIGRVATNDFDVASNGNGTATVAWPEYDGTVLAIKERQITVAGTSGPIVTVSDPLALPENTNSVNSVQVRGHADGTASIAWSEQPTPFTTNLNVRRVGSAGVAGSIRQITSGSSSAIQPARIAAHSDGSVTTVWGTTNSVQTALRAAHVATDGNVLMTPVLDTSGGGAGIQQYYDIAPNETGKATVVARRATRDVVSWQIDSNARATPFTTLEPPEDLFPRSDVGVVSDGQGAVVAMWPGLMPSSSLTALRAARIGSDNAVIGEQTLFPSFDAVAPGEALSSPAPAVGATGALPIWGAWADWNADPAQIPTSTRQVYAARYPLNYTPPVSGCPAIKLIGVRGSGEPDGLGKPVGALVDALEGRGVLDDVDAYALKYPAAIYPVWGTLREYTASVATGRQALVTKLTKKDPCSAESRYILAGYSQGAHIIGDVLSTNLQRSVRSQIAAAVLFGDPRFNPDDPRFTRLGTFKASYGGLLGPRDKKSITGATNDYPIRTYCQDRDPFCQGRQKVFGGFGLPVGNAFADPIYRPTAHEQYHKYADDAAAAIKRLATKAAP